VAPQSLFGKWVFRVDSDEVMSAALLAALPAMLRADDVVQYAIRRQWSFRVETFSPRLRVGRLADSPLRNEPSLLRFSGALHTSAEFVTHFDGWTNDVSLDCGIETQAERAAKASHYSRIRPKLAFLATSLLTISIFPRSTGHSRKPVAHENVPRLQLSLAATGPSGPRRSATGDLPAQPMPEITFEEIDRHWAAIRPGDCVSLRGRILDAVGDMPNESRDICRVHNSEPSGALRPLSPGDSMATGV